jgi:putative transposase
MARHGRYFLANQPLHVIQRGNNREPVFFHESDYRQYKEWLQEAADAYGCAVHAYVLMTNHVHLLVTPAAPDALPRTMQSLGRRYVRQVNRLYQRTGTLWEGRYRAAPIDSDEYFFSCCRYIELNPVRAGMARHPRDYVWSSYRAHAEGKHDPLAVEPPIFRRLGNTAIERRKSYRNLFRQPLAEKFLDDLRAATNGGWALGNDRFKQKIAKALGRRVTPLPAGRPPKSNGSKSQLNLL